MQDVLAEKITEKLERAMAREYGELLAEHEKDYREFYDRVALSLPEKEENAALPTDERLQRIISGGTDEGLAKLLFDYGRYLLIGCSRPGGSSGDAAGYLEQGFHGAVGQQIYDQHQYGNELLAGRGLRTAGMPHGTL